jgi:hypothetical protein
MLIFSRLSIFLQSLVAEPNFLFSPRSNRNRFKAYFPFIFRIFAANITCDTKNIKL